MPKCGYFAPQWNVNNSSFMFLVFFRVWRYLCQKWRSISKLRMFKNFSTWHMLSNEGEERERKCTHLKKTKSTIPPPATPARQKTAFQAAYMSHGRQNLLNAEEKMLINVRRLFTAREQSVQSRLNPPRSFYNLCHDYPCQWQPHRTESQSTRGRLRPHQGPTTVQ